MQTAGESALLWWVTHCPHDWDGDKTPAGRSPGMLCSTTPEQNASCPGALTKPGQDECPAQRANEFPRLPQREEAALVLKCDSASYITSGWFGLFCPSIRPVARHRGWTRQRPGLDSATHTRCSERRWITNPNHRAGVGRFCHRNSLLPSHLQTHVPSSAHNSRPPQSLCDHVWDASKEDKVTPPNCLCPELNEHFYLKRCCPTEMHVIWSSGYKQLSRTRQTLPSQLQPFTYSRK